MGPLVHESICGDSGSQRLTVAGTLCAPFWHLGAYWLHLGVAGRPHGGPTSDDGKHSLECLELRWESVSLQTDEIRQFRGSIRLLLILVGCAQTAVVLDESMVGGMGDRWNFIIGWLID